VILRVRTLSAPGTGYPTDQGVNRPPPMPPQDEPEPQPCTWPAAGVAMAVAILLLEPPAEPR
jgi:hypothetical protein